MKSIQTPGRVRRRVEKNQDQSVENNLYISIRQYTCMYVLGEGMMVMLLEQISLILSRDLKAPDKVAHARF